MKGYTLRNPVPGLLFEFFDVHDIGLEDEIVVFDTLFGGVVLQIFIGEGRVHFL